MSGVMSKILPILLIIYIVSPFDAHPLFLDDLIAAAVLLYTLYRNARLKRAQQQGTFNDRTQNDPGSSYGSSIGLNEAYSLLGIKYDATMDEISRAYKDKIAKSHPDKVNHLSKELQETAMEITLKLNRAYEMIKESRAS
jgi:DnaJ-domain-containing protein 1